MNTYVVYIPLKVFMAIRREEQDFLVRKDNHPFEIGDRLYMVGIDEDGSMSLRQGFGYVNAIMRHDDCPEGIAEGYVVLGVTKMGDKRGIGADKGFDGQILGHLMVNRDRHDFCGVAWEDF